MRTGGQREEGEKERQRRKEKCNLSHEVPECVAALIETLIMTRKLLPVFFLCWSHRFRYHSYERLSLA